MQQSSNTEAKLVTFGDDFSWQKCRSKGIGGSEGTLGWNGPRQRHRRSDSEPVVLLEGQKPRVRSRRLVFRLVRSGSGSVGGNPLIIPEDLGCDLISICRGCARLGVAGETL